MTVKPFIRHVSAKTQRGVAAVEFAIVVFVLLLIGAGLVEFGRTLWYYDALAKGTRDAARYLSSMPASQMSSEIDNARQLVVEAASAALVPGFALTNVEVRCAPGDCTAIDGPGDVTEVMVSVSFPITLGVLFPFISSSGGAPQATRQALTLAPQTTMPYLW
jgi:Flp pilus assembly protein TadG